MFKFLFALVLLVISAVSLVIADEIYIYGPPQNGIYHPSDIMDVRYRVRSMGMTRIWATSARLIHMESNKTISDFPTINWSSSASTSNDSITKQQQEEGTSSIHSNWTISADIPIGKYSLIISGNTTYLCSKNGNGSAPFKHCTSTIYKSTTFFITNGTSY